MVPLSKKESERAPKRRPGIALKPTSQSARRAPFPLDRPGFALAD
jgi:hypothetical protein